MNEGATVVVAVSELVVSDVLMRGYFPWSRCACGVWFGVCDMQRRFWENVIFFTIYKCIKLS